MKILVQVKPGAKGKKIERVDKTHFKISVKEPAKEGRANSAVVKAVADYFGVSISRVTVVSGLTSREKALELN